MKTYYNGQSKSSGIYQIRNETNERIYIGSAKEFKSRLTCHLKSLRKGTHHNKFLQNDFNKCGEDAFIFEVIEVVEGEQSDRLLIEQRYIDVHYDNQDSCYNFMKKTNNEGRSCFSKTPEETRKLISENSKAMWADEEWKEKRLAKARTAEFRKKQSEKQKLVAANPKNGNSSEAHKKRFASIQHRKKQSKILKDAWAKDDGTRREAASLNGKACYAANKSKIRKALVEKTAKSYRLISPSGEVIEITNLAKFCRDNNVPYNGSVYGLFSGKVKSHYGWTSAD